jgi:hypothetical protein
LRAVLTARVACSGGRASRKRGIVAERPRHALREAIGFELSSSRVALNEASAASHVSGVSSGSNQRW